MQANERSTAPAAPRVGSNATHCLYSAIARLISYHGTAITEANACVASSNLGFGFGIRPRLSDGLPSIRLTGVVLSEAKMALHLGVSASWRREADPGKSWKITEDVLRAEGLQVVATDIFHIPYLLEHYQRHHFPHILILTGIRGCSVEVDDNSETRLLGRELLIKARSGGPCGLEHDWWDLRYIRVASSPAPSIPEALAAGFGADGVDDRAPMSPVPHPAGEPEPFHWGDAAADAFAKTLLLWPQLLSEEQLKRAGQRLYYQIAREVIFPRRLFNEVLRAEFPGPLADRNAALIDRWTAIAGLVLKNFLYLRPPGLLSATIGQKIRMLVSAEQEQWRDLVCALAADDPRRARPTRIAKE
jgi:hypothetical protein